MRTTSTQLAGGGRRRWPRFQLDLDWFVESHGCSAMGRGLELTVRGAALPVSCRSPFTEEVVLHVSLPARERMFRAKCSARMSEKRGWVLTFTEVAPEDLQLLGHTLIGEFGVLALPERAGKARLNRLQNVISMG
ncbi:MAG: hypothetical protein JNJ54_06155 [Myxococcaceae bacterium]|nr:hypothetical protein [Myxococcaceae bacterium]